VWESGERHYEGSSDGEPPDPLGDSPFELVFSGVLQVKLRELGGSAVRPSLIRSAICSPSANSSRSRCSAPSLANSSAVRNVRIFLRGFIARHPAVRGCVEDGWVALYRPLEAQVGVRSPHAVASVAEQRCHYTTV